MNLLHKTLLYVHYLNIIDLLLICMFTGYSWGAQMENKAGTFLFER